MEQKEPLGQEHFTQSVLHKLKALDRLHLGCVEASINALGLGLHRSQHMTLMYLAHHGGALSQKEIAEEFGISAAAVASNLKGLEQGGYVERQCDQTDTRRNLIALTPKGQDAVERSHRQFHIVGNAMMENLSVEEAEAFSATLEKIINNLKHFDNREENK